MKNIVKEVSKQVKFIGKSFWTKAWINQNTVRDYKVIKNRKFSTGMWGGSESVLTTKGEWICDTDCDFFKGNFEVLSL